MKPFRRDARICENSQSILTAYTGSSKMTYIVLRLINFNGKSDIEGLMPELVLKLVGFVNIHAHNILHLLLAHARYGFRCTKHCHQLRGPHKY
jgi:hypothetical protein